MTVIPFHRTLRRNGKPPVEFVRPRAYSALCEVSRSVNVPPSADVRTGTAHRDPFDQTPLSPSEGRVGLCVEVTACPPPVRHPGLDPVRTSDGESKKLGAPYGTAVPKKNRRGWDWPPCTVGSRNTSTEKGGAHLDLPVAPPQNLQAEDRVLGTLIVFYTPALVHVVQAAGVKWVDFYRESNRVVYRAILRMHKAGEHVDTLTVNRFLECQRHPDRGSWLEIIGGPAHVEYLAAFAQVNGLREVSRMVAEDGRWRRWLHSTLTALEAIHARDEDGFWEALARVREDVKPGDLKVLEGGDAAGEKAA